MKRTLRLALAAAGVAGLFTVQNMATAGAATQCDGTSGPTTPNGPAAPVSDPSGQLPYVYSSGGDPMTGSGFIGISGSAGYLEIGGNLNTQTGGVSGSQTDTGLNGTASTSGVCVNGTTLP